MSATTITQSSVSPESQAKVALAARRHKSLFAWNIVWLAFAGLFTVWLSWRVWSAGNAEQSAIADAADERVSIVERAESDSKIALKQVEIDLSAQSQKTEEQRQRAADSEARLLELKRLVTEPRTIPFGKEFDEARGILKAAAKGVVEIEFDENNREAAGLGYSIDTLLRSSGWTIIECGPRKAGPPMHSGTIITYWQGRESPIPESAAALREALSLIPEIGDITWQVVPRDSEKTWHIDVGPKF